MNKLWNSLSRKEIPEAPPGTELADWVLLLSGALNARFVYPASHNVTINAPTQRDPMPSISCQHATDPQSAPILSVVKTPLVKPMKEHEFAAYVQDLFDNAEGHIPLVEPQRKDVNGLSAYLVVYDVYQPNTAITVRTISVAVLSKESIYFLAVSAPDYLQEEAFTMAGVMMGSFVVGKE